jgi:hypothetical protein
MSFQANAIPVGLEAYVPFYTMFINLFTYRTHHPSSQRDPAIQSRRASWDQKQEPVSMSPNGGCLSRYRKYDLRNIAVQYGTGGFAF